MFESYTLAEVEFCRYCAGKKPELLADVVEHAWLEGRVRNLSKEQKNIVHWMLHREKEYTWKKSDSVMEYCRI